MMVYEILCGMFGTLHLRQRANCQMKDFEKNFRRLKKIVEKLNCDGSFVCRIITSSKFYAGRLKKIELVADNRLKFFIQNCHPDGGSNSTVGILKRTVNLRDVLDIQVVADKSGQPVFWSDVFPDLLDDDGDLK